MLYTASEIITQFVCPSLGTIMASAMFGAPIASLKKALSVGSLGDLNPTPWAFMTGNCLGWVAYAFVIRDIFVLVSNLPGFILSVWLNVGAAKLLYVQKHNATMMIQNNHSLRLHDDDVDGDNIENAHENEDRIIDAQIVSSQNERSLSGAARHEILLILILILWGVTLTSVVFLPISNDQRANVIGLVVNMNLIVFYGAPLSTIVQVFTTRSSRSIHRRTLAMGLLNSFFWMVYGFALSNVVIFIPNFSGFMLSVIQLLLCIIFSDHRSHHDSMSELLVDENDLVTNDDDVSNDTSNVEIL